MRVEMLRMNHAINAEQVQELVARFAVQILQIKCVPLLLYISVAVFLKQALSYFARIRQNIPLHRFRSRQYVYIDI